MHFEVEQKFRVASHEPVVAALASLGAKLEPAVEQVDIYYQHPERDFQETDEAFRIRSVGERNFLTYKGPKVDATTKTRHEEEVSLADGSASRRTCDSILGYLGFKPAAIVIKRRRTASFSRDGFEVEIALDDVDQVGEFVELEVSVDADRPDAASLATATRTLGDLAATLELSDSERRSYLELLLSQKR